MPAITEVRNVNIYEPVQKQQNKQNHQSRKNGEYIYECINFNHSQQTRKVLGNIRIQFMINEMTTTYFNNKQNEYNYGYNENYNQTQFDNQ